MQHIGVWPSLVGRLVRDQETAGSNPATPTIHGAAQLTGQTGSRAARFFVSRPGQKYPVALPFHSGRIGQSLSLPSGVCPIAYRSRFADERIDRLFSAILRLRSHEDCYRFFEDLCTVGELQALAQRLQVAELLRAGTTYEDISARTGMSSATISRIKRFLVYGADGYRLVLDRMAEPTEAPPSGVDGGASPVQG